MALSTKSGRFALDATPAMRADGVVAGDRWRIGIITDSLVRFEWSETGVFEDRPTQTVLNRDFGVTPRYTVTERDGRVIIDTDALTVTYDGGPFSKEGLSVVVKGVADSQFNTWHYGDAPNGNLRGTARTLDEADGAIELDPGVISRDGWAVIDDSAANVIVETDTVAGKRNPFGTWIVPRETSATDLYFFGYGRRYIEAVQALYRLTGPTPLLPRFALGNWWSRYYRYSEGEYLALMDRFKREGIPFTTAVIDMDWHRVDDVDPQYGSGWTGYSWNRTLFPDPERFLRALHAKGLKTTLNVHPRDGVRAFEDAYPQVARRVGLDPAGGENVEFDLTNPDFVDAYFDMHHGLEDEGVDFWWVDWQQGGVTRQRGLDPLWMLNHMHYLDSGRGGRWPLTFSRYAGPGSHRYPVGFSGDTVISWRSLAFQPYFTATASNIGYGWWSHDIGGHMFGYRDEELEARWYQLGTFSPINRLHSSASPFSGKEPWNFEPGVRAAMVAALRLRHMMLPYLYTMNYRAACDGRPLVEPMYWQSPNTAAAYDMPNEFRFGTELIVAPITSPNDPAARRGRTDVWLPTGTWFDFFDGRRYVAAAAGGRRLEAWRAIDRMPVFAKAGGIVPMSELAAGGDGVAGAAGLTGAAGAGGSAGADRVGTAGDGVAGAINDIANPTALRVLVFPGADGSFVMREDDGSFAGACGAGDGGPDGVIGSTVAETKITFAWRAVDNADGMGSADAAAPHDTAGADGAASSPHMAAESASTGVDSGVVSRFAVSPVVGARESVPETRDWTVVFRGVAPVAAAGGAGACDAESAAVRAWVGESAVPVRVAYDAPTMSLSVTVEGVPASAGLRIEVAGGLDIADDPVESDAMDLLLHAQMLYHTKELALDAVRSLGVGAIGALHAMQRESRHDGDLWVSDMPASVAAALEEILLRGK